MWAQARLLAEHKLFQKALTHGTEVISLVPLQGTRLGDWSTLGSPRHLAPDVWVTQRSHSPNETLGDIRSWSNFGQ